MRLCQFITCNVFISSLNGLFLQGEETALSKYAKKILLAPKPAPVLESAFKGYFYTILPFCLFLRTKQLYTVVLREVFQNVESSDI